MQYKYKTQGVCSTEFTIDVDANGVVGHVEVTGGCMGNLQGLVRLMEGRPASEIAEKLAGIDCHHKGTSCPDQMSKALRLIMEKESKQ